MTSITGMSEKITVRVPHEVLRPARAAAAKMGVPLSSWIVASMDYALKRALTAAAPARSAQPAPPARPAPKKPVVLKKVTTVEARRKR